MIMGLYMLALAVVLSLVMSLAWLLATKTGQSGWVDAFWSFAVGLCGAAAALVVVDGDGPTARQLLVAALALAWSLRLGLHIVFRTARGGEDDPRYADLKRQWGSSFPSRLFWFLQIQAAVAFVLVVSIMAAARNPAPAFGPGDWIGIALMLAAVLGEAIADRQLSAFRSNPGNKGRVCDVGLWGLSRHPNYFFEWLGWIAYAVIAFDPAGDYPLGWAAIAGPVLMYWLLVHVSGIPPLEAHMLRSRGDVFSSYQARVNAFWPGPPRTASIIHGRQN